MNYLFTAAGRGTRFLKEGIKPPKPLIKVLGNELLIWSMDSFNFIEGDKIFIVSFSKHNVKERLYKKIHQKYPGISVEWLEIDQILEGQLLTAREAVIYFNIKGPLLIHNCDTFYKSDSLEISSLLLNNKYFGIIPCFQAEGDHWSFVKTNILDNTLAEEVREKERISNNCTVGTYIFSSSDEFINLSDEYLAKNNKVLSEFYIAPIYQYAIKKNKKVKIVKANNVKLYGTLKELLINFEMSYEELLGENSWNGHQIKTLVIDIDKTICQKDNFKSYSDAIPINGVCDALRREHSEGAYIILFTSRNMRTFRGSMGLINKFTAPTLISWLSANKIPYDEIYFGKPWGNEVSYIDDKALLIDDFIEHN